uniref:Helicase ATP-binding domain-containing protein n=1 Tax=viral metagenome TaxID=1070528 RepID=A0A6C0ID14_9ZZZZ
MIKPTVEERERVAVIIKGQPKSRKTAIKIQQQEPETKEEGELSEEEHSEEDESKKRERDRVKLTAPLIVDETQRGYDREALFKKLKENKLTKVTLQPIVESKIVQEQLTKTLPITTIKKAKKLELSKPLIIEEEEEEKEPESPDEFIMKPKKKINFVIEGEEEEKDKEEEIIPITVPKNKPRKTSKVQKGIAVLGPESVVTIGDTDITSRLPKRTPPINIKVSSYYMNNREIFVNFINSLFEPYKKELQENKENISCDDIGQKSTNFSLLTHQKIVRDYMNLYTPYRGLLLYHGLGSGKTATSIAIAEGMKDSKRIIIMTPASLRANYIEELKKAGDLFYKRNQYWEWISTVEHNEAIDTMSAVLNLPREYIHRHGGAWFINIQKKPNFDELSDLDKRSLDEQLNEMINQKYLFINYNGLRSQRLSEMTSGYTRNIFDNSVVIIDEAHNLISRIVNKIKKEKPISESNKGEKETLPISLSMKLYEFLLSAKNARIVLLSGTPVINYPNEFGILFNILRGYIKTWRIPLNVKTNKKIDTFALQNMLLGEKSLDYIDYSPSSKILTITRNPFGFKNKIKKDSGYQGVSNIKKDEKGNVDLDDEFSTDNDFERKIISILRRNDIDVVPDGIEIKHRKALPDDLDGFLTRYVNDNDKSLKNVDALKRRILGLSSYFRSAQENLLPKYNKTLGVDYHIIRIPMSNFQFKIYESARHEERKTEKPKKAPGPDDLFKDSSSTYRIFSRLYCNYVMPERPLPMATKRKDQDDDKTHDNLERLLKESQKDENNQDIGDDREGEIEGDEILDKIGGNDYKERIENALKNIENHPNDFLSHEALQTYSPKFLNILENIQDPEYIGLHLVYSQFRTIEGIGIFSLVLDYNGFTRFKITKNTAGVWVIDIPESKRGQPTYALYTGTETSEEKEIIRHIYNGEWDDIPQNIASELKKIANNNNTGEIIKVFMITSSGSEGINLRNTRYVHIMEPYWHPVRTEQVIGRARRICSHKALPQALQTVEVFVYLMIFSPEQLKSDEAIELKRKDLSKSIPKVPLTSDQFLYEISEIKANLTLQLTDTIKESAFDCYIYSNGKCVNFGDPTNTKFASVPDYAEQQNDITVQANKMAIEWSGKPVTLNGVTYVYRRINKKMLYIYDKASYEAALKEPTLIPLQIGTLETNEHGEQVFKQLVT